MSRGRVLAMLFGGLGAACALFVWKGSSLFPPGNVAKIYVEGQCVMEVDLSQVEQPYTVSAGPNTVLVGAGEIRMLEATCPDRLCVHQGVLARGGAPIVCLPNRVMITVGEAAGPDGVTR